MDDAMAEDIEVLRRIARAMLDADREPTGLLAEAAALRDWFEARSSFRIDAARDLAAGESWLDSGRAVSPTMAALCLRELARTAAFVRGLDMAIRDAMPPERSGPVRVLYAGCGPYATLALPLMALFSPAEVRFTLLDIHAGCLEHAESLIASLDLADHVEAYVCEDAARYRMPVESRPDVIVSETMAVCLRNEPQVAIARHLLAQAPAARMVPASVSIEACLINGAREHVLMPADHDGEMPEPRRDRVSLGTVFELDAGHIRSWAGIDGERLPAGRITMPSRLSPPYRPYLLTRIAVYGDVGLRDYDTGLTLPQPLRGELAGGETLRFHYRLGKRPGLRYELEA